MPVGWKISDNESDGPSELQLPVERPAERRRRLAVRRKRLQRTGSRTATPCATRLQRVRTNAVYRAKLGKDGRTITVDGDVNYSDNTNNSNSFSNVLPLSDLGPTASTRRGDGTRRATRACATCATSRRRAAACADSSPTRNPSPNGAGSLQYRISYDYQERDKKSYITGGLFDRGTDARRALSNSPEQLPDAERRSRIRYSKERNTFIANVFYQRSSLDGQIVRDDADKIRHSYNNDYFMMGQLNINRENSLRLYVSSYTDNPSITDLQNVADVSDAQNITKGNPDLNPTYSHRVNFTTSIPTSRRVGPSCGCS